MGEADLNELVSQTRAALVTRDEHESLACLQALAPIYGDVPPVDAVDLLERSCVWGDLAVVQAVYQAFPEIVYESWALALALRAAHEDVARLLLERGVDLLGNVRQPTTFRALLPHEGTFTRFDLTRTSPTLFLNPLNPTVSTEVFEPFGDTAIESLRPPDFAGTSDLSTTCTLVATLAHEGRFDPVVYDDLLRAALVRAWQALRHEEERDEEMAETCLALAARLLEDYHMRGQGTEMLHRILGSLIVPKAHPRIVAFVCEQAPEVFFERLDTLSWLQRETDLVADIVKLLSPSTPDHNGLLLRLLACQGRMEKLELLTSWNDTLTRENVDEAMDAATRAGQGEAAAWLLSHRPSVGTQAARDDLLADLLL